MKEINLLEFIKHNKNLELSRLISKTINNFSENFFETSLSKHERDLSNGLLNKSIVQILNNKKYLILISSFLKFDCNDLLNIKFKDPYSEHFFKIVKSLGYCTFPHIETVESKDIFFEIPLKIQLFELKECNSGVDCLSNQIIKDKIKFSEIFNNKINYNKKLNTNEFDFLFNEVFSYEQKNLAKQINFINKDSFLKRLKCLQ